MDFQVPYPAPFVFCVKPPFQVRPRHSQGFRVLKQIALSIVILALAALGWAYFVPGARDTLAGYGIALPALPGTQVVETAPGGAPQSERGGQQGGGPQAGGPPGGAPPGRGGFGGGNRTATVVVQPVILSTINDSLAAIGEGAAVHSVTVTTPASGTLASLEVKAGDAVKAGDLIGQLDSQQEQIALDKARLAERAAQEALQRTTNLANANSASTVQLAAAQLDADNAALEVRNAELALERRSIVAPISGTVGLLQVTPGNAVGAQSAVTTIDDTSSILVTFWVPERYAGEIALNMPVEVMAVALPGQVFDGRVTAVDSRIDSASRTLQVQASIPNDTGRMRPGMSFSVTMKFPGDRFPTVNPLAIQWSADGSYVWAMVEGKAKKVMAQIIQRNSDGVLVKGELAEGDPIITEGVLQLSEGAAVQVLGADAPPG